jgi:hypothetical protein
MEINLFKILWEVITQDWLLWVCLFGVCVVIGVGHYFDRKKQKSSDWWMNKGD